MNSKNLMIMTFFLLLFYQLPAQPARVGARKPPSIQQRLERTLTLFREKVNITEDQVPAIRDTYTEFFKSADQLIQPGQKPEKKVFEPLEKVKDEKLSLILSADQFEKYLSIKNQLKPGPPQKKNR